VAEDVSRVQHERGASPGDGPPGGARYLAAVGEAGEVPRRSPGRGPPYWKSQVLRRQVLEDEQDCASHGEGADEAA
jgi:hypothetical protein